MASRRSRRAWLARVLVVVSALWGGWMIHYALDANAFVRGALDLAWIGMAGAALWALRGQRQDGRRENWALVAIYGVGFCGLVIGMCAMSPHEEQDQAGSQLEPVSAARCRLAPHMPASACHWLSLHRRLSLGRAGSRPKA